jgi:alpha-glutamyl/putrescinyl thymine pyrophosphorylase clade 1
MVSISEIKDPLERYLAFLRERDAIYQRKASGEPWPWTDNPILQQYKFTEVYRERDRTSLHYQETVRNRYGDAPIVFPATVLYRWFNRMETCNWFFNQPMYGNQSAFERFIETGDEDVLFDIIEKIPTPHVTGSFIINGMPGYTKGVGVMNYFIHWCKKPWLKTWESWRKIPPNLLTMNEWIRTDAVGLGSFMSAQLVADLKYRPFMLNVSDWWTWASPGPGSQRGLNVVHGRPMMQSWNAKEWLEKIQELRIIENEELFPELGPFHAQDTQNHLCEYGKYEKVRTNKGRPRQVYHVTS